jgi:predicted transposase YbfD/YdcC
MAVSKEKLHIVTAYITENGLSLCQLTVDEKTNEIPVVRDLIEMIDIRGKTLTSDAMRCQKDTVATIISGGGEYVVGLKGNQKQLHNDVSLYIDDCIKDKRIEAEMTQTTEKSRNRYEKRTCFKASDISWLENRDECSGLKSIYAVRGNTTIGGKRSEETSILPDESRCAV